MLLDILFFYLLISHFSLNLVYSSYSSYSSTSIESNIFSSEDYKHAYGSFLEDLVPTITSNKQEQCQGNKTLKNLDLKYLEKLTFKSLPFGGTGIVSQPRKMITGLLTKAALALPEGDIVETGCFIGTSAALMMDLIINFDNCNTKLLWVFDSFEGLPELSVKDASNDRRHKFTASMEVFKSNLQNISVYHPDKIVITKGWFNQTLPFSPVEKISFLRLDGDLYQSTWDALEALYERVVPGGYIYIDDYGSFKGCKKAVDEFRKMYHIYEPFNFVKERFDTYRSIHFEAVWWMKRREQHLRSKHNRTHNPKRQQINN